MAVLLAVMVLGIVSLCCIGTYMHAEMLPRRLETMRSRVETRYACTTTNERFVDRGVIVGICGVLSSKLNSFLLLLLLLFFHEPIGNLIRVNARISRRSSGGR